MEGDSNFSCLTYENVLSKEDSWTDNEIIWLMGKKYVLPNDREQFCEAAKSKLWFTYRKGFDSIGGTGPTSDSGWGCMLRCGQMMLAQTLLRLKMSPQWKWRPNELQSSKYYEVLKDFADERTSCYSIHQIAQMGVQEGKEVGQWFGPNTIAQVLKKLSAFDNKNDITVYVAMDNTICTKDVEKLCLNSSVENSATSFSISNEQEDQPSSSCRTNTAKIWKPLVLFIPLRLGLSEINPVYFENIKECLTWKESVGIIGGKPNHAYYFIGHTNTDYMVFLDPHTTQPAAVWDDKIVEIEHDNSYHCEYPSKMPMSHLDPSLALGFLCKTKKEFEGICERVKTQKSSKESLPLFGVVESFPTCTVVESKVVSVSAHNLFKKRTGDMTEDENACLTLDSDEDLDDVDEEFEILEIL
ncbi:cysteine protease ATG4B-like [Styela clava]